MSNTDREKENYEIRLNDLLQLSEIELKNTKVRLVTKSGHQKDANGGRLVSAREVYDESRSSNLVKDLYWNYKRKVFKAGERVIGLARLGNHVADKDHWLLFHIGTVTRDLDKKDDIGYEHEDCEQYAKFINRVIVSFHNRGTGAASLVRKAEKAFLDELVVFKVEPGEFKDDAFPGYAYVRESWNGLKTKLTYTTWQTALENQKAVYLITDKSNGKQYVGSATGQDRLLQRWQAYTSNRPDGGNVDLKGLGDKYIRQNFQYSILECFPTSIPDEIILERESWWKDSLLTRDNNFGYNEN